MAVDQTNQIIYAFEFKRTLDREHGCVQQSDEKTTEPYASLVQIVKDEQRMKWQLLNFIDGMKSMNKKARNESMEVVRIPKQTWDQVTSISEARESLFFSMMSEKASK